MKDLCLAPGVEFDKDAHEYTYKGKPLKGITGSVCKRLNLKYGGSAMNARRAAGTHAHDAIEEWIKSGGRVCNTMNMGVVWLTRSLLDYPKLPTIGVFSEVLVSDHEIYASAVDIILLHPENKLTIIDAKNGTFKREYLEWQLGVYKYFIEKYTNYTVEQCVCAALKEKQFYTIKPRAGYMVQELLYEGRE